jgi:hypothetical protein
MKIVARIKGGLGNQLFCYAAARRLALINNFELVIDNKSGFERDFKYHRKYSLHNFNISARLANPRERLEPFSIIRRRILKYFSKHLPNYCSSYIEQVDEDFDESMLILKLRGDVYLDGLWQDHRYFEDISTIIRNDLKITPPTDFINMEIANDIKSTNSVAVHIRWFDSPGDHNINNISVNYYKSAIDFFNKNFNNPKYFIFSDNPDAVLEKLNLIGNNFIVTNNKGDESAFADLWLMTLCRNFIIANSTFSWWGAWLAENRDKIIVYPKPQVNQAKNIPWHMSGTMPAKWVGL